MIRTKTILPLLGSMLMGGAAFAQPMQEFFQDTDELYAKRVITSKTPMASSVYIPKVGFAYFEPRMKLVIPEGVSFETVASEARERFFKSASSDYSTHRDEQYFRIQSVLSSGATLAFYANIFTRFREEEHQSKKDFIFNTASALFQHMVLQDHSQFSLKRDYVMPFGFNWRTCLTLNPHLAVPSGTPEAQEHWVKRHFASHFHEQGLSYITGVPPQFNWRHYLALNPHFERRFKGEQRTNGLTVGQGLDQDGRIVGLTWQRKLATWLQRVVKIEGPKNPYPWMQGVPENFNWQTYRDINPSLVGRFASENELSSTQLDEKEWQAKLATWLQLIVINSIKGSERPLPWVQHVPSNFEWPTFAVLNPDFQKQFDQEVSPLDSKASDEERLDRTRKWATWLQHRVVQSVKSFDGRPFMEGMIEGFNYKDYLDLNPDILEDFKPADLGLDDSIDWSALSNSQKATWLQQHWLKSFDNGEGRPYVNGIPNDFNWRNFMNHSENVAVEGIFSRWARENLPREMTLGDRDKILSFWAQKYWLESRGLYTLPYKEE